MALLPNILRNLIPNARKQNRNQESVNPVSHSTNQLSDQPDIESNQLGGQPDAELKSVSLGSEHDQDSQPLHAPKNPTGNRPTTKDSEFAPYFAQIPEDIIYRSEFFPQTGPLAWLDRDDCEIEIERRLQAGELTREEADICRKFAQDGYVVIPGLIDPETADAAWLDYVTIWQESNPFNLPAQPDKFDPTWGRTGNVHKWVMGMHGLLHHPKIVNLIDLLLGKPCIPYQTIPSFYGSEQPAHSDAIHMTTFPLGFLAAAWIALEDIHPDSGPLVFYPGSHKLPYLLSEAAGIGIGDHKRLGRRVYIEKYEKMVQDLIRTKELKPSFFTANKGDVLIWHHNLLHGGSPVNNPEITRKSLVCHYFAEGVLCYHDLDNALADIANNGDYIGIVKEELATEENFDEQAYLLANRDVAEAVKNGIIPSGYSHFQSFGKSEGRKLRVDLKTQN